MDANFALPWVALADEGGVFINDAKGNTVLGMGCLEALPSEREFTHAELIVRCVNRHAQEFVDDIRGNVLKLAAGYVPPHEK